ncbi:hypothetical protein GCM10027347_44930 [Larkinella harenae]
MQFDPENNIVQLCGAGMEREGEGKPDEAFQLVQRAWREATNDVERCIAAHYMARHQSTVIDKLAWDEIALRSAINVQEQDMLAVYPSLYLNIGKCHEDLKDFDAARNNYQLAQLYADELPDDGYGKMIRSGIRSGLERTRNA